MGRMKEAHEVERILKQLLGMKVPAEEIQTLSLGHFYAAIGNDVKKVYVLPVGVPEDVGAKVARGELTPESVRDLYLRPVSRVLEDEDLTYKPLYEKEKTEKEKIQQELNIAEDKLDEFEGVDIEALQSDMERIKEENAKLHGELSNKVAALEDLRKALAPFLPINQPTTTGMLDPSAVGLQRVVTVVDLEEIKKRAPKVPTDIVKGKVLQLARDGFFSNWQSVGDINAKLIDEYRFNTSDQAINGALKELVDEQILGRKSTDRNRWKLSPDVVFEGKEVEG
jgi:polyhydroxyalkanoate synthesis regulator phasin